jgi:hypothetical protein
MSANFLSLSSLPLFSSFLVSQLIESQLILVCEVLLCSQPNTHYFYILTSYKGGKTARARISVLALACPLLLPRLRNRLIHHKHYEVAVRSLGKDNCPISSNRNFPF